MCVGRLQLWKACSETGPCSLSFLAGRGSQSKECLSPGNGTARVWLAVAPSGQWAWSGLAGRVLRLGDTRERAWIGVLVSLPGSWNWQEAQDGDWRWTGMRSGALCWAHCSVGVEWGGGCPGFWLQGGPPISQGIRKLGGSSEQEMGMRFRSGGARSRSLMGMSSK